MNIRKSLLLVSLLLASAIASPCLAYTASEITGAGVHVASDRTVTLNSSSSNATRITISRIPEFGDTVWQDFNADKFQAISATREVLFIYFMSSGGVFSDMVTVHPDLREGDIVKANNNPDVYIIKYASGKLYKRLILSPTVFKSYGHLRWTDLKVTTQEDLNRFTTSSLVRVAGDNNTYELTPLGDTGERAVFDTSKAYDADSVYEINATDRNSYVLRGAGGFAGGALASDANAVFLHHSTGGVIWDGGVSPAVTAYNAAHGTHYQVSQQEFPKSSPYGWKNYPYDYWNIWVNHAGSSTYLGEPTLETLTQTYDVIAFKHCYPVASVQADTGKGSVSSETKSLENYKLQYDALKAKMHEFPNNRFIVWTGAALTQAATSEAQAVRAKAFAEWVKNDWDEPGDNIFVWDFRQLETDGGLYLTPAHAKSATDSHPNATFAREAAPLFAQRIIDVIEGRG